MGLTKRNLENKYKPNSFEEADFDYQWEEWKKNHVPADTPIDVMQDFATVQYNRWKSDDWLDNIIIANDEDLDKINLPF